MSEFQWHFLWLCWLQGRRARCPSSAVPTPSSQKADWCIACQLELPPGSLGLHWGVRITTCIVFAKRPDKRWWIWLPWGSPSLGRGQRGALCGWAGLCLWTHSFACWWRQVYHMLSVPAPHWMIKIWAALPRASSERRYNWENGQGPLASCSKQAPDFSSLSLLSWVLL